MTSARRASNAANAARRRPTYTHWDELMASKVDYFDFNVTGFIIGCLIVGIAIGIAIAYLVPWLWSFISR